MTDNPERHQQIAQFSMQRQPSQMTISEIRAAVIDCERPAPDRLMERITACLAAYYDPDTEPHVRAMVRGQYATALSPYPTWAVARAFDEWARTGTRRPSPADLVILAERQTAPFFFELRKRKERADEERAEREASLRRRVSPERAQAILEEYGMTEKRLAAVRRFPRAQTMDQAEAMASGEQQEPVRHWSDTAAPDGPEWQALRAARAKNPLMNGGNEL